MATQGFDRLETGGSNADILINQARNRIMNPNVDREPNDDVLLVLGATNAGIKGLANSIEQLAASLPKNGNGRMAKVKQIGVPAAGGAGLVAVVTAVARLLESGL